MAEITLATSQAPTSRNRWLAGLMVASSVFYFAKQFDKSTLDDFIIVTIAIGAGLSYYKLKQRFKIKNDGLRALATYFALLVISAALIGFFTRLANG